MWGQVIGGALGALGGSKGQQTAPGTPKFVKRQVKRGFSALNAAAERPADQAIAKLNTDQLNAANMVRGNIGLGRGAITDAQAAMRRAMGGVTGADIESFVNPHTQNVVRNSINEILRAQGINAMGIRSAAEKANAFGGDRAVVAEALANEDYTRQLNNTVANLYQNGYQSAVDSAFRNNASILTGAQGLIGGVNAERGAAAADAQALGGVGDFLFNYEQSRLDHPLKMAQIMTNAGTSAMGAQSPTVTGGGLSGAMAGIGGGMDLGGRIGDVLGKLFT